jgi:hypothetical protein
MRQIDEIVPLLLIQQDEYWLPFALRSIEGHFGRIVIYNVGSTDETQHIIEDFRDRASKDTDLVIKNLPDCPPIVQGTFRNSMIAEARSDYYLILDGDEVYSEESAQNIRDSYSTMLREYELNGKLYGVVRRIEVCDDLQSAYGANTFLPHHRLYHRLAIWESTHPGERAVYHQKPDNEFRLEGISCIHFHNCRRSRFDNAAQGRARRKKQETYRRGGLSSFDVWEHLPVLHKQTGFPTHPVLARMQANGSK